MKYSTRLSFLLFFLLIAGACSNHVPQVSNVRWDLFSVKDAETEALHEELSIFLQIADEDGIEDIEEIYVIYNPGLEYWHMTPDVWVEKVIDGETWIGSGSLMSDTFPRDEYKYLVIDKSGDRTEGEFFLDVNKIRGGTVFPSAEVTGDKIRIRSPVSQLFISFYNDKGEGVHLSEIGPGIYPLKDIFPGNDSKNALLFYISAKVPEEGYVLKSGPYYLKDDATSSDSGTAR